VYARTWRSGNTHGVHLVTILGPMEKKKERICETFDAPKRGGQLNYLIMRPGGTFFVLSGGNTKGGWGGD